jgi:uncharacterized protein (DUF58 family)
MLTLVGWALFLAVLADRPELAVVAAPLVVVLLTTRLRATTADLVLTHEVSAERVFDGDSVSVTVTVMAKAPLALLEIWEPLPPFAVLEEGATGRLLTLREGGQARWSYRLRCQGRRRLLRGAVRVRVWDRWGLRLHEAWHGEARRVSVYPRIVPLRRLPRPVRTQTSVGNYVSTALGEGLEPGDIRPFAPGDRIKHVNWRASLRLGKLHVTQYQRERNADVVLMLDTLAEIGRPVTSLDACATAAAALASAYLARKDRVGLIEYGGLVRWVRPASGRAQFLRLLDSLLDATVTFTYVAKDLDLVPPRVLPPQALVIALSPLLDGRFVRAATDLAARGFDVVLLVVSPIELARSALEPSPERELACRLWAVERQAQIEELRRHGLRVVEWEPADPLEAALAPLARRRPRLAIAG